MNARVLVPVGMLCLLVVLVVVLIPDSTAETPAPSASKTVTDAVIVIRSDVGRTQKLLAFERIRKDGSAAAIGELVKLTASSDTFVSATACTTLGRMKSDAAKGKLKGIITDSGKSATLRTSAMNALARCGTLADRAWIADKTENDAVLKSNLTVLQAKAFWN